MAQYSNLKAYIEEKIYENGTRAITGDILQDVLKVMTDDLGEFYQMGGVASPSTDPGTPDAKVIYFATEAGTYTNFGGITLEAGEVALLIFETSWTKETLNVLSSANGGVKTANLADGAVTTEKIAGGAVETAKIANNAVTSGKVADGAIGTAKIADAGVTADKIAANAVESAKIKNGAVTEGKINDGAVTADKVAANAVTTAKIADDAVTTAKLNDGTVTEDKIATDAVTSGKVKDGAIGTAKIAAGAVTHAKIGAGAVEESNIKDGAVTSDKIANGAVGSYQLAEGAFSAQNLADGSVTTDKLADDAVTAEKIADGAVTAGKFANGSVTTIKLGSGAVTTEKIGDGMVTRQKLADSSVGTSKIIDGAVTTDKVADGAITDAKLENPVSVSQNTSTIAIGTNEYKIQQFLFAENCPFIKEMYINELGVQADVAKVNIVYPTYIRFANSAGTAFVARTKATEKNNGIIPIRDENDESVILGYVVVDWSYFDTEWPYKGNNINDIAKNVNYSPAIQAFLDDGKIRNSIGEIIGQIVPISSSPWIKELYINELGISEEVSVIHSIIPSTGAIRFANSAGTAFVARITFTENVGIFPVVKENDATKVLGYALIDGVVGMQQQESSPQMRLNEMQYSLDYSPSIKGALRDGDINKLGDTVYEGDLKDLVTPPSWFVMDTHIFIQYPKQKIKNVNLLRYKAHTGTINFYKVAINGTTATFQLISSFVNDAADEGKIIEKTVTPFTIADNECIGINGAFYIDSNDAQGYTSASILISTGVVTNSVALIAFEALNGKSIEARLDKLEKEQIENNIDTTEDIGHSVGNVIPDTTNIVVLASDGSGDYTNFVDAHNFCTNTDNRFHTTLIIMPGIYNIPVVGNGDIGYVIRYNIKGIGNPILNCDNTSVDVGIKQTFSPFNMDANTPDEHRTVCIEGITLISKNVRYCVHDECGGLRQPSYTHIFKNCKFVHLTEPDTDWASPRCIGGGLGNKGLIVIDNCEFQSKIATSIDYHTGFDGGAESSKVIIKNCTLANNTVSATSTTLESNKSITIVQDCILNAEPIHNDPRGWGDMELITKDNIII